MNQNLSKSKNLKRLIRQTIPAILMLFTCSSMLYAQNSITVKGTVTDNNAEPLIGATVLVKGQTGVGTLTDIDGNFQLKVPSEKSVLVVSYVGMTTKEVKIDKQRTLKIVLEDDNRLDEVVVVGFGQQKKASVVGAIAQTTGEVLERTAGIGSVGSALTGNLPGVVTVASSGQPGEEDPRIYIRGAAAWNQDAQPLILVDGVKRDIKSVDITSVATVSVLKDASATAVYGVEGANGVILITTKRGQEGKARIDVGFNATLKAVSKLPHKYDSYDGYMYRNQAIEHELALGGAGSWAYYRPQTFINNFRNQDHTVKPHYDAAGKYLGDYSMAERYPNIDWQDEMFKDFALSYNTNLNISGGTKYVKYFVAFDFQNEGDMTRIRENNQGYKGGYTYNRLNVRSNLDFQITKTTLFKVSLAGSNARQKTPHYYYNNTAEHFQAQNWVGAYRMPPNIFPVKYSDGSWGFSKQFASNVANSPMNLATTGYALNSITRIYTDFSLEQKLDFITKGLLLRGTISWDNRFDEGNRGIYDQHQTKTAYILPEDGVFVHGEDIFTSTGFDFYEPRTWDEEDGSISSTSRGTEYSLQLYWARQFGIHNVTAMGNWKRRIDANNSDLEWRREDWVFRTTYDIKSKYFAEFNGAYNGSQKFSPENRFAFFCSGAAGWMLSEEKFMDKLREKGIIDMFKIRGSIGQIGDDNAGARWAYLTNWEVNGPFAMATDGSNSPFTGYKESTIASPDLRWATVTKKNIGFDYAIANGMFAGSFDWFRDDRTDIFISGADRTVPSFYGAAKTPDINKGKMKNSGFEFELRFNKVLKSNGMRFWANANYTYAHNTIILKDDPALIPSYRKAEGYSQGQYVSFIDRGFIGTYDELYSTPYREKNDNQVLIGDHYLVDFNGDGKIDETNDKAPYGYTGTPEHTYNATIGWEWKGFSIFAQLYGVFGVTRDVTLRSFPSTLLTVYDTGTQWHPSAATADVVPLRFTTGAPENEEEWNYGTQYLFDGSFFRLKNVEVAYTWTKGWIKKIGFSSLKLYVNANNLFLITKMPDDRESNLTNTSNGVGGFYNFSGGQGAYPTVRRFNFGFKLYL
ncbi:MAG: TonB-dependent receptor [Bacteroidaceae bacterium]|nr:TonB-dependent receptor [Bacteroidaceae bacterium]